MSVLGAIPRWAYAALAGVIGFAIWLALHDRAVVRDHERKVGAAVAAATTAANEAALKNDAARAANAAARAAAMQEVIDHAKQAHPDDARRPAGPVVNAVADRLRRDQAAAGHAAR